MVFEIDDHHRRSQDSLDDLSGAYFRAIPTLQIVVFVRIFRRRVSHLFACVTVVIQRASDGRSGVITDVVGFGSCPLSASRVVGRIRQLTPFSSPVPREIYPLATHERIASNPWAANPPNPHNRPFISTRVPATTDLQDGKIMEESYKEGDSGQELQIQLWPIYHGANERVSM